MLEALLGLLMTPIVLFLGMFQLALLCFFLTAPFMLINYLWTKGKYLINKYRS